MSAMDETSSGGSHVLDQWSDLKETVVAAELDVVKNAKGSAAAGVRARKALREVCKKARELVHLSIALDKSRRAASKAAAPAAG